jgi:hypothetical protein
LICPQKSVYTEDLLVEYSDTVRIAGGAVVPTEELQSIASILAAGYLRYRRRIRREEPLDNPATSSPHGHEANGPER